MKALEALEAAWQARWPDALEKWSRFTRLHDPVFCHDAADEKREHLTDSFAMIRLTDHSVIISLRQVKEKKLQEFPVEVLAHEVGHHVLCPADLADQGRLLARLKRGLPGKESLAPFVANVYADLLINDRLQRQGSLRMADVYLALRGEGDSEDRFWAFYMRTFEVLWGLPRGTLAPAKVGAGLDADAQLGARLARVYAKDWLRGAGRFAALCFPYLPEPSKMKVGRLLRGWHDTEAAGAGAGDIPDGLAEVDDDELDGAIHPSLDPELAGLDESDTVQKDSGAGQESGAGGNRRRYREPADFAELLKSLGVNLPEDEVFARYYRELALPHLIRFPMRETVVSTEPLPEGLDVWDVGEPLSSVDWVETALHSPSVVPGVTTVQRVYGVSTGNRPEREPIDLYLGIDCSGSMQNPRVQLSYPVIAGVVMALSALRAGARVMATLSGEPGSFSSTKDFLSDEKRVLQILTGYLGTGYAFNVARLNDAFGPECPPRKRKAHVLIVSDTDLFMMLDQKHAGALGWDLSREALAKAGGGGTYVLHIPGKWRDARTRRMEKDGWAVHTIDGWEDLVAFARDFSRRHWENTAAPVRNAEQWAP